VDTSYDDWPRVIATNLDGTFVCMRTGASWVVYGGMLQMGPQASSHLTSNDWRKV
jgi:hypothetical protein